MDLGRNRMFLIGKAWRCSVTTMLDLAAFAILSELGMSLGIIVSERHCAVTNGLGSFVRMLILPRRMSEAPLRSSLGV